MICKKNCSLNLKISNICRNEYNYFLNKKNVVGVALGYKITRGFCTYKKCITVFVAKKLSITNLSKENIIPKCFKGIQTDVVESGIFTFSSFTSRVRPVINGYSIGNSLSDGGGTSGCLVHDEHLYILSCNHVLAMDNAAPIGSAIVQPSIRDGGGVRRDVVGHLSRFISVNLYESIQTPPNIVDCALCKLTDRSIAFPSIAVVGTPKGIAKPHLNERVEKVGRTTEYTVGKITNLSGTLFVNKPQGEKALFVDQILTTSMSNPGDSGSVLLNNNTYALGLLMSSSEGISTFNPIDEVLKALHVQLSTS